MRMVCGNVGDEIPPVGVKSSTASVLEEDDLWNPRNIPCRRRPTCAQVFASIFYDSVDVLQAGHTLI